MTQQYQLKAYFVAFDKISPALREMKKNLNGYKRELESFGRGGIKLGVALGAGIGIASKSFADFEDAALRLKSAMMGASGNIAPEFEKINDLAVQLGNKLPGNTADFQNMMTALVQNGVSGQEILGGIGKAAAYLGVQMKMAPEEAATFAAKMRTATQTTSSDMMSLMDIIQRTSNFGVKSEDMLAGFAKMSPVMDMIKVKGLEASKVFAPLLTMGIQSGMAGESAGNAYRKVFQAAFDQKKMDAANKMLGGKFKLDFTNGKGEFGGLDKMFVQLEKLQGLSTLQRTGIIKKIFGDDAETLQIVNILISRGKKGLEEVNAKMAAQAGLQARVESLLGGLKSIIDAALGNFQNLLATIGETFNVEVKSITTGIGDLVGGFGDFIKNNPNVIRSLVAVSIGLVAVKIAALGLAKSIGFLKLVMAVFGGKANPWMLAFQAFAIAAGLIIANWEPVSNFFKNMWDSISTFFNDGWAGIKNIIDQISAFLDPFVTKIQMVGQAFGSLYRGGANAAFGGPSIQSPVASAIAMQNQRVSGALDVRFANAPQGMRITGSQSSNGFGLNPDVGYSSYALGAR